MAVSYFFEHCHYLITFFLLIHIIFINLLENKIKDTFYLTRFTLQYFLFLCSGLLLTFFFKIFFLQNSFYVNNFCLNFSTSIFSDTLICLALIVTIVSWIYLSERFLFKTSFFIFYFFIFIIFTINLVYTSNLLVMFINFEFIFLPSLFFVYKFGYAKKVIKTINFLLTWTLSGSFIVLVTLLILYNAVNSLDLHVLSQVTFTNSEKTFFFFMFFLGFGVKIPIWPFHYWLTKVHVEAPAGFSIFLSGFLVKTAFYCYSFFFYLFNSYYLNLVALTIILWGTYDASVRMWGAFDIKRLIAFATIQEMNLMMILLILLNNYYMAILNVFLLFHGCLSALLFFLIDQIQKRTHTRNLTSISGLYTLYPQLCTFIWISLLIFRGFPIFIKFFIEWELLHVLIINFKTFGIFFFLICAAFGVLGFCRIFFSLMFGQPGNLFLTTDLLSRDLVTCLFLVFFLFFLNFFFIFF